MSATTTVATRTAMAALTASAGDSAILTEAGREGVFAFSSANHSSGGIAVQDRSGTTVAAEPHDAFLVTKTGGTNNVYDAAAIGAQSFSGDYEIWMQRVSIPGSWLIGTSASAFSTNGYADIDFAISGGGTEVYFYGDGSSLSHLTMTSPADWLVLVRTGSTVKAYESATRTLTGARLLYTFSTSASGTHYLKGTLYESGAKVRVIALDKSAAGDGAVAADTAQALYVAGGGSATGANGAWVRQHEGLFAASWFGAGAAATALANTQAFAAAADLMCWLNGGTLLLEAGAVYTVGHQTLGGKPGSFSYAPDRILYLTAFSGEMAIDGRGATLKLADGLKYGSFDPSTGSAYYPTGTFTDTSYQASPAEGVIFAENFTGSLTVENLTIDGNIANASLGGHFGDTGWQIMHAGLQLLNPGRVTIRNVDVRGIGTDGCTYQATVPDKGSPAVPLLVENSRFEYNGRQGFSLAGGRGATFVNCGFNHTGRSASNPLTAGPVDSNPHSGFDMEPDAGNYARDIAFLNCEFLNNTGSGYTADSGRTQDISFHRCRFSGDNSFAIWIGKPGHVFRECIVAGVYHDASVTDLSATYEEGRATQYIDCIFKDDPAWTFNGSSIYGVYPSTAYSDCCFERCNFDYSAGSLYLPESSPETLYRNCTLTQAAAGRSQTNATFEGLTVLTYASGSPDSPIYFGRVLLNDVEQFVASETYNWPSIAAGSSTTHSVTVPGARTGDGRMYLARMAGGDGGLLFSARASADDTVTVTASNPTGAAIDLASDTLKVAGLR